MGRKKKHESDAAKIAASEEKWRIAGNTRNSVWIPDTPEAKEALKAWAQQQRLKAGTMLPQDQEVIAYGCKQS